MREDIRSDLEMFDGIVGAGGASDGNQAVALLNQLGATELVPDVAMVDMRMLKLRPQRR